MNKFTAMGLAAALTMAAALPASAAINRIATADFGRHLSTESQMVRLSAPTETLMLTAKNNSVTCTNVSVTFGNGRTRNVFSGTLREGRAQVIDLPGLDRNVKRITLTCRSLGRRGADVVIAANQQRQMPKPMPTPSHGPDRFPR